ncbi:MAG: hypothetical protein ACRD24_00995 [Terriglobales bacterium]|jgi:hypothetical protein
MPAETESYLATLTALYLRLPETPRRLSRFDHRLARHLFQRHVPLALVEAAFLLASARRASRPASAPPLGPIRSLHYFLPVIEELLKQPLPASYLAYLRSKVPLRPPPH